MRIITKGPRRFDGVDIEIGAELEVPTALAQTWIAQGKAEVAPTPVDEPEDEDRARTSEARAPRRRRG